jgi:hypothetical protein
VASGTDPGLTPEERARRRAFYESILPHLRTAAWLEGYCLAVHGTQSRDLDVLAVPWIENAAPAEQLVDSIAEAAGGVWRPYAPGKKPHGRLAWTIIILNVKGDSQGLPFIDLSVMPTRKE